MNPKRLIEEWLPIKEIGVESRRENSTGQHPPPNRLHVWWARRPLTASRAAILGSLLPAGEGNEEILGGHLASESEYHNRFLKMLGILGDPVAAQTAKDLARARNIRLEKNPFDYPRAFSSVVDDYDIRIFRDVCFKFAGNESPSVLDPMSGGGSIPLEALRLGFPAKANELNPVACVTLKAIMEFPLRFKASLASDIERYGGQIDELCRTRLTNCFPSRKGEHILDYIWARTVPCPTTGKQVPLSPNWWLRRQPDKAVAVHLLPCEPDWEECRFEMVRGKQADLEPPFAPSQGTIARGNAISPWTGDPITGSYIKQMAQEGKMDAQLFPLCVDEGLGRDYRLPTQEDVGGTNRAKAALEEHWDAWVAKGLIPTEEFPQEANDLRPRTYGMEQWYKLFSPRQLLAMVTYLEELQKIAPEMEQMLGKDRAAAVRTYLAMVLDKVPNYNTTLASWHAGREVVRSVFDRHDFSFKWSFTEMNMALKGDGAFPWALDQVVDAYKGLCRLIEPSLPLFSNYLKTARRR